MDTMTTVKTSNARVSSQLPNMYSKINTIKHDHKHAKMSCGADSVYPLPSKLILPVGLDTSPIYYPPRVPNSSRESSPIRDRLSPCVEKSFSRQAVSFDVDSGRWVHTISKTPCTYFANALPPSSPYFNRASAYFESSRAPPLVDLTCFGVEPNPGPVKKMRKAAPQKKKNFVRAMEAMSVNSVTLRKQLPNSSVRLPPARFVQTNSKQITPSMNGHGVSPQLLATFRKLDQQVLLKHRQDMQQASLLRQLAVSNSLQRMITVSSPPMTPPVMILPPKDLTRYGIEANPGPIGFDELVALEMVEAGLSVGEAVTDAAFSFHPELAALGGVTTLGAALLGYSSLPEDRVSYLKRSHLPADKSSKKRLVGVETNPGPTFPWDWPGGDDHNYHLPSTNPHPSQPVNHETNRDAEYAFDTHAYRDDLLARYENGQITKQQYGQYNSLINDPSYSNDINGNYAAILYLIDHPMDHVQSRASTVSPGVVPPSAPLVTVEPNPGPLSNSKSGQRYGGMESGFQFPSGLGSFSDGKQFITVFDEYIADVLSNEQTSATTVVTYPGQPANSTSFPWLSLEAPQWQKYYIDYLEYYYLPASSGFPTASSIGDVYLNFNYDASDPPPTTVQQISDSLPMATAMAYTPFKLVLDPVEINNRTQAAHYIRPGALPGSTDIKAYDFGNLFVTCIGNGANGAKLGRLMVRGKIRFEVAILPGTTQAILNNTVLFFNPNATTTFTTTQPKLVDISQLAAATSVPYAPVVGSTSTLITVPAGNYILTGSITFTVTGICTQLIAGLVINGSAAVGTGANGTSSDFTNTLTSPITTGTGSIGTTTLVIPEYYINAGSPFTLGVQGTATFSSGAVTSFSGSLCVHAV